jgi:hypothetical protein
MRLGLGRRELAANRVDRVHTPRYLQELTVRFKQRNLIADIVSPRIKVAKQSDKYRIFGKDSMIVHESRWAPGSIPNAITVRWSEDQFFADIRKLRGLVLDTERRNSDDDGLDLEQQTTDKVTAALQVSREKRVADLFTTAGNYAASHKITKAGGSEWDSATALANSQALLDMQAMIQVVAIDAGVPTTMLTVVIPEPVYLVALQNNAGILARVQYSQTGVVTADILKTLLNVKQVIFSATMSVGSGPEVADSDVVTGFTSTYLWGDTVWIGLVAETTTNQDDPSFSRSFNWTAETAGQERQIRKYRAEDEGREGDWVECKEAIGEKLTFAIAGAAIFNTLSTI